MIDVYYTPEKFGLQVVGSVEWGPGGYEYDLTTVWFHAESGSFYIGHSSGCSCSTPFRGRGIDDLEKLRESGTLGDIMARLREREVAEKGKSWVHQDYSRQNAIINIVDRARGLGGW